MWGQFDPQYTSQKIFFLNELPIKVADEDVEMILQHDGIFGRAPRSAKQAIHVGAQCSVGVIDGKEWVVIEFF